MPPPLHLAVSLVIPVRDEERSLDALLATIEAQSHPPAEIIIVDGGSTDRTAALLRDASEKDRRIRVIEAGPASPGRGRNIGIAAASNEWIALTDAGIRLETDWLERLAAAVRDNPELDIVHGNFEPVIRSFFQKCVALCTIAPRRDTPAGRATPKFIASTMLKKHVWQSVGGFPDERAGEDLTFMEATEESGFKIGYAPQAVVHWQMQPSIPKTFRRFRNYSYHNALSGRQWDWHYGIARMYIAGAPFIIAAPFVTPWLLVLPAAGGAARVLKTVLRRREGRGMGWVFNPVRLLGVGAVLLLLDCAMYVGWVQATLQRLRSPRRVAKPGVPV